MALPVDRRAMALRLRLEAQLARCENELYAARQEIARLNQRARYRATVQSRRKAKKKR